MALHKYTEKESLNLLIGQNGFDVIPESNTATVNPDTGSWVAIQALGKGGGDAAVEFLQLKVTANVGDSIDSWFYMIPGEILYGNFSGVINHTDSTAALIAYRG